MALCAALSSGALEPGGPRLGGIRDVGFQELDEVEGRR
jgi:hypothetical protein